MGEFIWHQWAQYVAIFASICQCSINTSYRLRLPPIPTPFFVDTAWAAIWGIFFRKFFWDFVNGQLMPGPLNEFNGRPCALDNQCGIVLVPFPSHPYLDHTDSLYF
jgi:hypothetical protein